MKRIILIFLLFVPVAGSANDEWVVADTWRESVWQGLNVIDWLQTHDLSHKCHHANNGDSIYDENNPFLNDCPTRGDVDKYFTAAAVIHALAAASLPADIRQTMQYITIGMSGTNVINNFSIGLKIPI